MHLERQLTHTGGDINFDVRVIHGYRRFCNKIYQATKYVLSKIPKDFKPLQAASKSGKESLTELWVLHKFNVAAAEINRALEARDFSEATQVAYQYFYNNLCDVYIENSKSIIQDGSAAESESAQQTLYTALEGGLTLLHPFMPFLTEELWQRLPRRPCDECPSIVKARYPQYKAEFENSVSEEAYELILALSKAIRSLAASYDIKEGAQVFIKPHNELVLATSREQLPSIKSLGGKATYGDSSSITILSLQDDEPSGCIPQAVGTSAAVFLVVKGRVDIDREIEKAKQRRDKVNEQIDKQQRIMNGDGWAKMKEEAQKAEKRKLEDAESEAALLEGSIEQFERLKLH